MTLQPTDEQQAIIKATREANTSLMIPAYAGTGKTSTIELASGQVRSLALALAFNKSIAVEMSKRLPAQFHVKTMNGLGHQALSRHFGGRKLVLDERKQGKIITQVAKDFKIQISREQWDLCRQLLSKAMQLGIMPDNAGQGLTPDTPEAWAEAADEVGIPIEDQGMLCELAQASLRHSNEVAEREGLISFDDQIYLSVCLGAKFLQYPRVFVDEAQDLNVLQHEMLKRVLPANGLLTAVGDSKQAIYQFRGAHSKSMSQIRLIRPAETWRDLPLTLTFRCPKVIVARQQDHAPGYRAYEANIEGRVENFQTLLNGHGEEAFGHWTLSRLMNLRPSSEAKVAILCRNNAPLFALAFKLLKAGVGIVMLGRDIGRSLQTLASKIAPQDDMPREKVAGAITEWTDREVSLARANGKEHLIEAIQDKADCLQAVLTNAEARDAGALRALLARLFDRESGQITLSSIHKSKGLEWDVVMHLDPWRIPSKWARQAAASGDPSQLEQENNLRYVCETRAKHTLVLANLEGFLS